MHLKAAPFSLLTSLLFLTANACGPGPELQKPTVAQELYARFEAIMPEDTLAIRLDTVAEVAGTEVKAALFIGAIDTLLHDKMLYPADTADFHARAYWRIALDEQHDACLIGIRQVWFQFRYLLVYSKEAEAFVDVAPVAWFYGGDGGQVLGESRIFDLNSGPSILIRELEHSLRRSESDPEEMEDVNVQSVSLWQFSDGGFREIAVRDTGRWIRMYPLSM